MRRITTLLMCEVFSLTILAGALVVSPAQAAVLYVEDGCRIDWDGDLMVTQDDYLFGQVDGYYGAWYIYSYTQHFPIFFPDLTMDDVDFNGDGVVDQTDYLGSVDATAETEGFYDAWYIYSFTPYAAIFFPEGNLCTVKPECVSGLCEASQNDCGWEYEFTAESSDYGCAPGTQCCMARPVCESTICATASQYCGPDHVLTGESWDYACPTGLGCCMPEPPCPTGVCASVEFECEPENEWNAQSDDYHCADADTTCCLPKQNCADVGGLCVGLLESCSAGYTEDDSYFCLDATCCVPD